MRCASRLPRQGLCGQLLADHDLLVMEAALLAYNIMLLQAPAEEEKETLAMLHSSRGRGRELARQRSFGDLKR